MECLRKIKGGKGLRRKIFDGDCYESYFYRLRLYKETIITDDAYRRT